MSISSLETLKVWLDATRGLSIPLGPSSSSLIARARELLAEIGSAGRLSTPHFVEVDETFPEIVYALCSLLAEGSNADARSVDAVYSLVETLPRAAEVDERADLLMELAFLRWRLSRNNGRYAEARTWRKRCARNALGQDHIRAFVASSFDERSVELNNRFLGDSAIAVAYWEWLDSERNSNSSRVAREASRLAEWLEYFGEDAGLDQELVHFLAASTLCTALAAKNLVGNWDTWDEQAERARKHANLSTGTAELAALLDHAEAVRLCQRYESARAEAMARELIPRFELLEYFDQVARVRFLLARTVKDQGRIQEALKLFEEVSNVANQGGDLALQCLALCMRAQALGALGQFEEADRLVVEAIPAAQRSGWGWLEGEIRGTEGELLRDRGDLISSIEAYTDVAKCYEKLGLVGLAAYARVILAETLLLANRPVEATSHIAMVLEAIESRNISSEAAAALGILREALCRQKGDLRALSRLRFELQKMKEAGRL